MNKLLIASIALVTVFSTPASAMPGPGSPPRFRDIPDISRNTHANPEHHVVQSTEQGSQSWNASGSVSPASATGLIEVYSTRVRMGAPLFLTKTTRNFAGSVLLALRPTR